MRQVYFAEPTKVVPIAIKCYPRRWITLSKSCEWLGF